MAGVRVGWFLPFAAAFGLAVCLAAGGCGNKTSEDIGTTEKAGVWIKADPNPVPIPAGSDKGTTTITWSTGDGSEAQVFLRVAGKDQLFSGNRSAKQEANWIMKGITYEFVLFAGLDHKKELAKVTVTAK